MIGLLNIKRTVNVVREVRNFFFILTKIQKNKSSQKWKDFKLRVDWVGRIYTIISLSEEDMGEQEEVKRFKVLEKMKYVNEYLTSLDLQEVIIPNIQEIKGTRSYLVLYVPYFSNLSYIWMGLNVFLPAGLIYEFFIK